MARARSASPSRPGPSTREGAVAIVVFGYVRERDNVRTAVCDAAWSRPGRSSSPARPQSAREAGGGSAFARGCLVLVCSTSTLELTDGLRRPRRGDGSDGRQFGFPGLAPPNKEQQVRDHECIRVGEVIARFPVQRIQLLLVCDAAL